MKEAKSDYTNNSHHELCLLKAALIMAEQKLTWLRDKNNTRLCGGMVPMDVAEEARLAVDVDLARYAYSEGLQRLRNDCQ